MLHNKIDRVFVNTLYLVNNLICNGVDYLIKATKALTTSVTQSLAQGALNVVVPDSTPGSIFRGNELF